MLRRPAPFRASSKETDLLFKNVSSSGLRREPGVSLFIYLEIAPTFFDLAAISRTFGEQSTTCPRTLSHCRSTGTRATCRTAIQLSSLSIPSLSSSMSLHPHHHLLILMITCQGMIPPPIADLSYLARLPSSFLRSASYMIFVPDYSIQIMSVAVHSTWINTRDCSEQLGSQLRCGFPLIRLNGH